MYQFIRPERGTGISIMGCAVSYLNSVVISPQYYIMQMGVSMKCQDFHPGQSTEADEN